MIGRRVAIVSVVWAQFHAVCCSLDPLVSYFFKLRCFVETETFTFWLMTESSVRHLVETTHADLLHLCMLSKKHLLLACCIHVWLVSPFRWLKGAGGFAWHVARRHKKTSRKRGPWYDIWSTCFLTRSFQPWWYFLIPARPIVTKAWISTTTLHNFAVVCSLWGALQPAKTACCEGGYAGTCVRKSVCGKYLPH